MKLRPFWSSGSSTKWKLRVYKSMVASILYYGLESVVLTAALGQRMDYFQAKCLRNMMKIQAAFFSKVSDKTVLDDASTMLYGELRKLRPFSKVASEKTITLLGHVIKANDDDQMKMIAIDAVGSFGCKLPWPARIDCVAASRTKRR